MPRVRRLPIRNAAFAGFIIALVAASLLTIFVRLASASCAQEYRHDKDIIISGQTLHLEVVQSQPETTKGLGGRSCIGTDQAMLFVLPPESDSRVWMKGMHFPIDIVWLNDRKEVIEVDENVAPDTYPQEFTPSGGTAHYILEMRDGRASQLHIEKHLIINL